MNPQSILELGERVHTFDGVEPLNEASTLALREGDEALIDIRFEGPGRDLIALGFAATEGPVEVMVDPRFRRGGFGTRMVQAALAEGATQFWAHGDLPGAGQIAEKAGLEPVRTLLILRLTFREPVAVTDLPDGVTLRTFEPGDEDAIVAVNARSFIDHPEQVAMDRADFDRRASSDWFDPAGLFVAERDGHIIGFHWTKIESKPKLGKVGEVYVVGVDPDAQGTGLGTSLTAQGLQHLQDAGATSVILYVEGDNAPALAVYHRLGFVHHKKDVLYSLR